MYKKTNPIKNVLGRSIFQKMIDIFHIRGIKKFFQLFSNKTMQELS